VGKELFTAAGPDFVEYLIGRGYSVFLDLKFHDIPNTVAAACSVAAAMGVWMVDIHASGGTAMMTAARRALDSNGSASRPQLVAITVLTSLAEEDLIAIGLQGPIPRAVERLARLAHECGLEGVVCSASEAALLRRSIPKPFLLVTPGIRLPHAAQDDQVRVVSPQDALAAGSDYLVIGRPITQSVDPVATLKQINDSLKNAL
jgi:orotidine-5'-phosphate decarboxylase